MLQADEQEEERDRVQLEERFRLFASAHINRHKTRREKFPEIYRYLSLTGCARLPPFSLAIRTIDSHSAYWKENHYLITPDSKQAVKQPAANAKRGTLGAEKQMQRQLLQQNPYRLYIGNTYDDFCEAGIGNKSLQREQENSAFSSAFCSSGLKTLCQLRFQVGFSDTDATYETMPIGESLKKLGELFFAQFYPLLQGEQALSNGGPLHLPIDGEKLQHLWGVFSLAHTPSSL